MSKKDVIQSIEEDDDDLPPVPETNPLDEKFKGMLAGEPRCGKSMQLADFGGIGEGNSKLIFNVDNKLRGVQRRLKSLGARVIELQDYEHFDFKNDRDLQCITIPMNNFLKFDTNARKLLSDFDSPKPSLTIIDSLTLLADDVLDYSIGYKSGQRDDDIGVIDILGWPEYKAESYYLASLFGDLKALNSMVLLTAHLTVQEDEVKEKASAGMSRAAASGKTLKRQIVVTTGGKKIGKRMPAYFHDIYNMKSEPAADFENDPATRLAISVPTEDCPFAGSQYGVPTRMDVTFRGNSEDKSLWQHIKPFLEEKF